jgi:hypothetical protein
MNLKISFLWLLTILPIFALIDIYLNEWNFFFPSNDGFLFLWLPILLGIIFIISFILYYININKIIKITKEQIKSPDFKFIDIINKIVFVCLLLCFLLFMFGDGSWWEWIESIFLIFIFLIFIWIPFWKTFKKINNF